MRVLQRIAGIFSRQRLNIEQLTVFETSNKGTSYFNIVIHSDVKTINRVIQQLQRIVELLEVKINSQIPLIEPEINFDSVQHELKEMLPEENQALALSDAVLLSLDNHKEVQLNSHRR